MQLKDNIKFVYDKQISVGNENCQNLLIKGDNKAILPDTQQSMRTSRVLL